ncbi:MAG: hypothetical protein Q8R13_04460 [bacterium]|nr:hypothetical protein [bacterium]
MTKPERVGGLYDYFNSRQRDGSASVKETAVQYLRRVLFTGKDPPDALHGTLIRRAAEYEFGGGYRGCLFRRFGRLRMRGRVLRKRHAGFTRSRN